MSLKLSLLGVTASLLVGIHAEQYPPLPTWKCTASGCVQQNTGVVLDKDAVKYAKGAPGQRTTSDYTAMGVTTSGNALTLYHYVNRNSASPRVYLIDRDTNKYVMMSLLGQELTVDVDFSTLPCGENGAFYLSEMEAGGRGGGGAAAGSGYCDAQCQGYCCNEMDILESNSQATSMTPHPCKGNSCDKAGCNFNPYAKGDRNFWGPGKTVDSSKPVTVITQFIASGGKLTQVVRKYIQNGKTINSGTISNCGNEGTYGGLTGMGAALGRGSKSFHVSYGGFDAWLGSPRRERFRDHEVNVLTSRVQSGPGYEHLERPQGANAMARPGQQWTMPKGSRNSGQHPSSESQHARRVFEHPVG